MSTSGVPWERPEAEHVGSWPHLACRPTRDVFCQTKEKPNCLKEIFLFFKPLKLGGRGSIYYFSLVRTD